MPVSKLRRVLERGAGSFRFRWVLPYPLLPPRYRKQAQGRNLILLLDHDFTLHLRWESSRLSEPQPLTPRAAVRLLREVSQNITLYKRELGIFARFVDICGERPLEGAALPERKPTVAKKMKLRAKENQVVVPPDQGRGVTHLTTDDKGGESPMGIAEDAFDE